MDLKDVLSAIAGWPVEVLRRLDEIHRLQKETRDLTKSLRSHALHDAKRDKVMSKSLDKLTKEVEENSDVVESAAVMIEGLAQQIRDASGDEEKLEQLAADLDTQQARLAEAVAKNTPFTPSGQ